MAVFTTLSRPTRRFLGNPPSFFILFDIFVLFASAVKFTAYSFRLFFVTQFDQHKSTPASELPPFPFPFPFWPYLPVSAFSESVVVAVRLSEAPIA